MSSQATLTLATLEQAQEMGLRIEEFDKIKQILGRTPNFTELSVFGVMWSEHCSYKNSIVWLKTLPKKGPHMLVEAGEENAGLVDIGDGLACCFKIESHNHPSALEPYQGAAPPAGMHRPGEARNAQHVPRPPRRHQLRAHPLSPLGPRTRFWRHLAAT